MRVPFIDLSRSYKALQKDINYALKTVMSSGMYILGEQVALFEKEFAEFLGVSYAVGVASGTEAITLSLWGLRLGKGDGVIVPANSLPSVWGVIQAGCRPVLVDVDPETFNLDPDLVEKILKRSYKSYRSYKTYKTYKIKAILPVHLYGRPAPIGEIMAVAKRYGVKVIEDCAQATGAEVGIKDKKYHDSYFMIHNSRENNDKKERGTNNNLIKVGCLGDAGIFSFYPTKNLGGAGDGGMVVTNNKDVYERVKILRMYGENPRYHSQIVGINSRLDELQAAILREKLPSVEKWNKRRTVVAQTYYKSLKGLKSLKFPNNEDHVYHLYVICTIQRDQLQAYLTKKGIGTMIHYPLPTHLQPSLKYLGYKKGDFPKTERISQEILSLPLYPEMHDEEVQQVCQQIKNYFRSRYAS